MDLAEYIEYMPNAKAFIESHPELSSSDGAILSLPSRVGYGTVEYLPFIREDIVRLLLDGDEPFSLDGTDITDDVSPFIDDLRFSVNTVDGAGDVTEITKNLNVTGNILDILGDYVRFGGLTASDAVGIFRYHIDTAYGGCYGTERSRLFLGESAAYDTDELVMLLICISACSELLSDSDTCVLGVNDSRELIYLMASLYGISDIDVQMHKLSVSDRVVTYRGERSDISTAVRKINRLIDIGLVSIGDGESFMRYASIYESIDSGFTPILPPVSVRSVYKDDVGEDAVRYSRLDSFACYSTATSFSIPKSVADDERTLHAVLRFIDYTYSDECLSRSYYAFDGICIENSAYTFSKVTVYSPTDSTLECIESQHGGSATSYSHDALGAGIITPLPTFGLSMITQEQKDAVRSILDALELISKTE